MPTGRTLDEIVRLGTEIIARWVMAQVGPEDDGKFVAVDVDSEDYEVDEDDYTAAMRLEGRRPEADVYLGCIGRPTTYQIRGGR